MWRVLHTDQRQKQNHKEENLLALHQESFPLKGGIGLMLNQGNILSPIMKFQRKSSSSSSFSASSSRRGWSGSFLENQRKSSESIPAVYALVWRSMESMLGSKWRSKRTIPVLQRWFKNSCLFPSSSRTFRTQSFCSFIAGQCYYSEQLLSSHLPYYMCV